MIFQSEFPKSISKVNFQSGFYGGNGGGFTLSIHMRIVVESMCGLCLCADRGRVSVRIVAGLCLCVAYGLVYVQIVGGVYAWISAKCGGKNGRVCDLTSILQMPSFAFYEGVLQWSHSKENNICQPEGKQKIPVRLQEKKEGKRR